MKWGSTDALRQRLAPYGNVRKALAKYDPYRPDPKTQYRLEFEDGGFVDYIQRDHVEALRLVGIYCERFGGIASRLLRAGLPIPLPE